MRSHTTHLDRRPGPMRALLASLAWLLAASSGAFAAGGDWLSQTQAVIAAQEYEFSPGPEGRMQAPNRQHGFRTVLLEDGFEVVDRLTGAQGFRLGLRTTRVGRDQTTLELGAPRVHAHAHRTELDRGGVVEWFVNGARGMEHGFTLPGRPEGPGPLVVEMALESSLNAYPEGTRAIRFDRHDGAPGLRYSGLTVLDARGRELEARFEIGVGVVRIVVDDGDARYPVTIDPLVTAGPTTLTSSNANAEFGLSVSTAGDVNGDGFSDVIVGAPRFDVGANPNAGRAFVFHGSASGPSTTPAWTVSGGSGSGLVGRVVATAGDVDGDRDDEVMVSRVLSTACFPVVLNVPTVELYRGTPSGLETTDSFSPLSCSPAFEFGASFGYAGDLNGDDLADVVIGAPLEDVSGARGSVYIYLGNASGTPAFAEKINGPTLFGEFGRSLGAAGDVNGDGLDDLIVGQPLFTAGESQEGRAFIYLGDATGVTTPDAWQVQSNAATAQFGWAVDGAGDVNGDGFADVVVGWPGFDNGATVNAGRVTIYLGGAAGPSTTAAETLTSSTANQQLGWSVATAGEVDGDLLADVVIGNNGSGSVTVLQGSVSIATAPTQLLTTPGAGTMFGASVSTAGDVNGDGYSDVLVGAATDQAATLGGRVYLYSGGPEGLKQTPTFSRTPGQDDADFGASIASSCDLNGDGFQELIVGAPRFDGGSTNEGRVFVYLGGSSGPVATPTTLEANVASALFGRTVACAGDIHNDGFDDLVVGAPGFASGQALEGAAYVFRGTSTGIDTVAAQIFQADEVDAGFGEAVSRAGDVNGDGYADIVVGAPRSDGGAVKSGRAFVFEGRPDGSGLDTTPTVLAIGQVVDSQFGAAVAWAGDFNRDGFSDVAVGAPAWDEGGLTDRGVVHLYLGGATGVATTSVSSLLGSQSNGGFGAAVGFAGDFNGDGFSDLIIGAPREDGVSPSTQIDEGRTHVRFGNALASLVSVPPWRVESNVAGALMGSAVGYAGDVNGDGFTEVVIGEPERSGAGGISVWHGSASPQNASPSFSVNNLFAGSRYGASVGSADLNGDGFADLIVGAPDHIVAGGGLNEGIAEFRFGGGGEFIDYRQRTLDANVVKTIGTLGLSSGDADFRIRLTGRSPAGRDELSLISEVVDARETFAAATLGVGSFFDTGAVGANGSDREFTRDLFDVAGGPLYKWRVRFQSRNPRFPRSRWVSLQANSVTEADVRTSCTPTTWFPDTDGDDHGDAASPYVACVPPAGYTDVGGDCNDADPAISPAELDWCDGANNDCNAATTDGATDPSVGASCDGLDADACREGDTFCASGTLQCGDTTADTVEICNGLDDDCDGTPDDGFAAPTVLPVLDGGEKLGGPPATTVRFHWALVSGADRYDVRGGDLDVLRSSGGDFEAALLDCAADQEDDFVDVAIDLATEWLLVRAKNCIAPGSFDEPPGSGQVSPRDAALTTICP